MLNFNSSLFTVGDTVAVAVSGGSDSMALLHALNSAVNKLKINIIAVNVEHGIRGKSSINDSNFVKDFCKKNNIVLKTFTVDAVAYAKENKLSIEQSARILRYECFNSLLSDGTCNKIATAHHLSDNAETVLLNLFRGTGLKGMAGIKPQNGKFIRPLLHTTKQEITDYIQENNVPFVTDETNFDDEITRNYVRLNLIPEINKIFPEVERSITRFSATALEEDAFLDNLAKNLIEEVDGTIKIKLTEEKVLIRRATVIAMKLLGVSKDYETAHLNAVINLLSLENGSKVILPKGITAIKEYTHVVFYRETSTAFSPIPFSIGEHVFNNGVLKIEKVDGTSDLKSGFYCDLDKLPKDTVIRTRADGDVFKKFGGGTKKLKDYYIDEKVPVRLRDSLPVIASKNQVFFTGIAISDKIKVDKSTKNMLKLTYTLY